MTEQEFLTTAQVSQLAGISTSRIRRLKNDDPNMAKFVKFKSVRLTGWSPEVVDYLKNRPTLKYRRNEFPA